MTKALPATLFVLVILASGVAPAQAQWNQQVTINLIDVQPNGDIQVRFDETLNPPCDYGNWVIFPRAILDTAVLNRIYAALTAFYLTRRRSM